jgi:hypothetical protein
MPLNRIEKSSMLSSSLNMAFPNYRSSCCVVEALTRSSLTRMTLIASRASFVESLLATADTISGGTALDKASSASMSA